MERKVNLSPTAPYSLSAHLTRNIDRIDVKMIHACKFAFACDCFRLCMHEVEHCPSVTLTSTQSTKALPAV